MNADIALIELLIVKIKTQVVFCVRDSNGILLFFSLKIKDKVDSPTEGNAQIFIIYN